MCGWGHGVRHREGGSPSPQRMLRFKEGELAGLVLGGLWERGWMLGLKRPVANHLEQRSANPFCKGPHSK